MRSDSYLWEIQGKISIELSLDVVDRLQQDVMRGFGAIPRRGAEVGGILLGATTGGSSVRVEDYELIPIEYKRGPSYRLSASDLSIYETSLHKARNGNSLRPIGYFRSHTRAGIGLSEDDLELLANYFPQPEAIVLLIRPFASKPGVAGFYFKEAGAFQSGAPLLEFPFRRKDLGPMGATAAKPSSDIIRTEAPRPEAAPPIRRRWPVLPIILLLLGVLLGYQAALNIRARPPVDAYALGLAIIKSGDDLKLQWNRESAAIHSAQNGTLTIEDGAFHKAASLTRAELQTGSWVPYHPITKHVIFRLDVSPNARTRLTETVEWRSNN